MGRPRTEDLLALGLAPDADPTLDEVRRAFRARALELHPDRGGDPQLFCALVAAHKRAEAAVALATAARTGGRCPTCKGTGNVLKWKGLGALEVVCPDCRGRKRRL